MLCYVRTVLQTEMYSVMTVSSEPPGSLGWLSFMLVLKSDLTGVRECSYGCEWSAMYSFTTL